jgi:hypothetical protein
MFNRKKWLQKKKLKSGERGGGQELYLFRLCSFPLQPPCQFFFFKRVAAPCLLFFFCIQWFTLNISLSENSFFLFSQ